jgi:methylmalonyl-CoA mutase C-terminal domain/subunit
MGVKAVFGPGTPTPKVIEWLQEAVQERRAKEHV